MSVVTRLLTGGLLAAAALLAGPVPAGAQDASADAATEGSLYVTAAAVYTGTGEILRPGAVAIEGGRIVGVGAPGDVQVPAGARRIEGGPHSAVIPGLVAAATEHLASKGTDPASIATDVRALDGYDFMADESRALSGGVTTVFLSPGSRRVVSGRGAVVKTAGVSIERRTLSDDAGLVAGVGTAVNRPPAVIEPPDLPDAAANPLLPHRAQLPLTRAGSLLLLRDLFGVGDGSGRVVAPTADGDVADIAGGRKPLWLSAYDEGDLRAALDLVAELGVKPVIVGAHGGHATATELATAGHPVVVSWPDSPGRLSSSTPEAARTRIAARATPAALAAKGIRFALTTADDASLGDLLYVAASATRAGLDPVQALAAVTTDAAAVLGVSARVGSLETGKDGDLVLLSGAPLEPRTFALMTIVDGRVAWKRPEGGGALVVRAAEVHVGDGTVFAPGEICVEDGRIIEVGSAVGVPPGARFLDLQGGAVTPGMIDAFSHAGLAGAGGSAGGNLTTTMTAADALDRGEGSLSLLAEQGVTTVLAAPGGTGRIAGRASVVRTVAGAKAVLVKDAGLVVRLWGDRDVRSGVAELKRLLDRAKSYHSAWDKYHKAKKDYDAWKKKQPAKPKQPPAADKKEPAKGGAPAPKSDAKKPAAKKPAKKPEPEKTEPVKPNTDEALAALKPFLDGKLPVLVRVTTAQEIRAALAFVQTERKMRVVLVGGDESWRVRAEIDKAKVPLIASPRVLDTDDGRPVNLLRELTLVSVPRAVGTSSYLGGAEMTELLAYAVRRGLSPRAAIRLVTGDAAALLGVSDQVGLLRSGRRADMVLLSAPPFTEGAGIEAVYADGQEVFRAAR